MLAAKSLQSCPTLCDSIDGNPPGSPIPGILQARTLEWVAISFSNVWKWKVKVKSLSHVWLVWTPWTAAYQAPPSMGFSRQEYWSGVPLPSPCNVLESSQNHTLSGSVEKLSSQNWSLVPKSLGWGPPLLEKQTFPEQWHHCALKKQRWDAVSLIVKYRQHIHCHLEFFFFFLTP